MLIRELIELPLYIVEIPPSKFLEGLLIPELVKIKN